MATSDESSSSVEQPKVSTELPPNYVPLPDDVKGRLCSEQCIKQVEHYRTHSFKIGDKLSKHERIHEQLKIDHKIYDEKILSLKESWNKTLKELELVTKQLEEMTKNFEQEKVAHAVTQVELPKVKSCKTMVTQLVNERGNKNKTGLGCTHEPMPKSITNTLPENFNEFDHSPENEQRFKEIQRSKSDFEGSEVLLKSLKEDDSVTVEANDEASNKSDPILDEAEFSGYNDPEYIKWKNEQKAFAFDQLIKKKAVTKTEVSNAKMQKSKLTNNQSETKQSKGKSVITSNDNTKAQIVKTDNVKPVKKKVSKVKTIKFVSARTFDMNSSHGNQLNSKIKSNSGLKTGSGPKTSAVNDKRFESKKVNSFKPRALMMRNQKFENNLDPKLEERFIALRRKQTNQAVGRNNFQPNLSNESNFQNLHYQQVRPRRPINSWFVDSGCSRHMTGNHALLQDFKLKNGTHVAFGGDAGGKITGEGTVSNGVISFDKVNYCAQLNFNLLSLSQICDKSYSTLFDDSFCYILKPGFKIDNEWVVVKAPRDRDVYKLDMSQIDAETETTCLIAHDSNDES
ncbi:hypothetical protein QVD17_08648 [Tagetes erecta]|uniref:Retrovirus-related Pol polyprotein from transposon TNT 1-94-like beta-barrel domain-containing protein n=1 Tax=Tagetes erecta TaxID=13708 RepID=A0AAD8P4L7_TARER|nr:hypothetical protein QVD17_08648 [Tagetes erecta]